jgi:hypothetical protein
METKGGRRTSIELPIINQPQPCDFEGYDAISLMRETAKLRKLITKRGTLEILIPLCCTTNPVRYLKFRQTLRGFSSKTLLVVKSNESCILYIIESILVRCIVH